MAAVPTWLLAVITTPFFSRTSHLLAAYLQCSTAHVISTLTQTDYTGSSFTAQHALTLNRGHTAACFFRITHCPTSNQSSTAYLSRRPATTT